MNIQIYTCRLKFDRAKEYYTLKHKYFVNKILTEVIFSFHHCGGLSVGLLDHVAVSACYQDIYYLFNAFALQKRESI